MKTSNLLEKFAYQYCTSHSSALWQFIAPHVVGVGYKIVIPDLFGSGGTSKPTEPQAYTWAQQAKDVVEIPNHEGVRKVISAGDDWGSMIAQRVYHFFPGRVAGITLLSAWYVPRLKDDKPLDLELVNDYYEKFDALGLINNPSLFRAMLQDDGPEWMKELFCVPGAFRDDLVYHKNDVTLRPFAQSKALRGAWISDMKQGGLTAPFCWYKLRQLDVHSKPEKDLPEDRAKVKVPLMYISGD